MEGLLPIALFVVTLFIVRHVAVRGVIDGRLPRPLAAMCLAAVWAAVPLVGAAVGYWPFNAITFALVAVTFAALSLVFDRFLRGLPTS